MAHVRKRYIEGLISRGLTHKGIVGIFGHRQVGKTTLLEMFSSNYSTFDRSIVLSRALENAKAFIDGVYGDGKNVPIAIDECQLAPPLFPELKDFVRLNKKPGLFLLSGSVRFTSRKAIKESLTGRILTYELLPFSISELAQKPMNKLPVQLLQAKTLSEALFKGKSAVGLDKNKTANQYLKMGGLPGLCFMRNDRDRNDLIESQLNHILDRDLRIVSDTSLPLSRLRILVTLLAEQQNTPINLSEFSRKVRISTPTLKKVLSGLESIFFIRQIACEGTEAKSVYFLEDQGEAHYLAGARYDSSDDLVRLAYANIRVPFYYEAGLPFDCFQFRMQGGAYVPLCFRSSQNTIGFLCSQDAAPSLSAQRSGGAFLKKYPGSKVIHLHPGTKLEVYSNREALVPIEYFL